MCIRDRTGTMAFTPSGTIDTANTSPALLAPISIGAYSAGAPAAGSANWANSTGLAAQTFKLDVGQSATSIGSISQFSSATSLDSTSTAVSYTHLDVYKRQAQMLKVNL